MVIKPSSGAEVRRLVARLADEGAADRDAAVARLTILGSRAVPALIDLVRAAVPVSARTAALDVLETIGDRRALGPACVLLLAPDCATDVALAAIGVIRAHLSSRVSAVADRSFETLTAITLDCGRADAVRLAAFEALQQVHGGTGIALRARLASDPSHVIRRRATGSYSPGNEGPEAYGAAADARLPDSPEDLRAQVAALGPDAPLTILHRLIAAIRTREAAKRGADREAWLAARGWLHQTLGQRASKVALYDLRETLEQAQTPLPVGFLAALKAIGDRSCLEPLAAAYVRWAGPPQDWWRGHLVSAFRDIVVREGLTRRHSAVRKVLDRHPEAHALLPGRRQRSVRY